MASVHSVSLSKEHGFSKETVENITLVENMGVVGDAHSGATVKHRSRVRQDPTQPNLRQVHLIQLELIEELRQRGFDVAPGSLGENITSSGIDLLSLPQRTRLMIGRRVCLEVTGLRNPCSQLDDFQQGLLSAVLDRDEQGRLIRRTGIMAMVVKGGTVRPGDTISAVYPRMEHLPLERV